MPAQFQGIPFEQQSDNKRRKRALITVRELCWPDVLTQPSHQQLIVRKPTQQRHADVRVRVDQARHETVGMSHIVHFRSGVVSLRDSVRHNGHDFALVRSQSPYVRLASLQKKT